MAHQNNYWSCSRFADWLRGTAKLKAGTSDEWDNWRLAAQTQYRFRYWLAEEVLNAVQDFVTWPVRSLYNIKYYINNRWVSRTHSLTAHPSDIKPGQWQDVGDRILPCMFNELVDFVEIETAWMNVAWSKEACTKYNPPFYASGWFRWRTWRSAEAGLAHLEWAAGLKNDEWVEKDDPTYGDHTPQALAAMETIALYKWWTEVYPNRPDPMKASGWSEYCSRRRTDSAGLDISFFSEKGRTEEDHAESRRILTVVNKMQAEYEAEDTEMLTRLIKIRRALWT